MSHKPFSWKTLIEACVFLPSIASFFCDGSEKMWAPSVHEILVHLSNLSGFLPAILITLAVAVLIGCAVECLCEPCKEDDDLFHHEVV
ncbi:MAG: hypothetical protein ACRD3F_10525 [Acidobacteriaceae bacterium]